MKKLLCFLSIWFFIYNISFSQENKNLLVNQFKVSYNIVSLELAYEHPLNEKLTLEGAFGLGLGNYIKKNGFNGKRIGSTLSFQSLPPIKIKI